MKFHAECAACLVEANLRKAAPVQDQALRMEYMRRICEIIAATDVENEAPPLVDARIIRLRRELLGIEAGFERFGVFLREKTDATAGNLSV